MCGASVILLGVVHLGIFAGETDISQWHFCGAGWDKEDARADEKVLERDSSIILHHSFCVIIVLRETQ